MLKSLRRKTLSDLKLNRGQFLTVWFVVMLGTAFYGAMYPAGVNMRESFFKTYDELHFMNFQVQMEAAPSELADRAREIDGVQAVEGRLVIESGLQLDGLFLRTLRLISLPDDHEPTVNQSDIVEGRNVRADDEILLLKSFADHHEILVGDTLITWINGTAYPLKVVGLAFNAEYIVAGRSPASPFPAPSTFGVAWMRYTPLAKAAGMEGQINELVIYAPATAQENRIRQALSETYPDGVVLSRIQTASGGIIDALIAGNFPMMVFFSGLFLVGSTVMTGILLGRIVQSERQRIGTMRAMGITRRELVQHYLTFGLLIGTTGGFVGTILGYLNSIWVMLTFINTIAGGTLPAFSYTPNLPFLLLGFAVATIGSTLSGIYPAWIESATPPGIALRPAAPKTPGQLSRLSLPFLPRIMRQAVRNTFRVPGRSLNTALGVGLGAVMIFAAFGLWDTTETGFGAYFDSNAFDLRIDMQALQPADALQEQVSQIEGVEDVQAALIGAVVLTTVDGKTVDTIAVALDETDPFLNLKTLEGADAFSRSDGVWIGHNLERIMGIQVGDTITLSALGQEKQVKVLGIVAQVMGGPVYIPRSLMLEWSPVFMANAALIRSDRADAVRDAAVSLPGMIAVEVMADHKKDLNDYLLFFRTGTIIFGFFGYVLTLAVLYNTVSASLRERQDELAVLRALGTSGREIFLTVTLELLVMAAIGILVGIPIGREVSFYLSGNYNTDIYGSVPAVTLPSYLIGLVSLLAIILLGEIPGLRAVHKIDLGWISKSQSI